jgi:hypothetical protein
VDLNHNIIHFVYLQYLIKYFIFIGLKILKDGNFRLGKSGSVGGGVYFADEPRMCCEKFMGRQSPTAKVQQVQIEVPELHILVCGMLYSITVKQVHLYFVCL